MNKPKPKAKKPNPDRHKTKRRQVAFHAEWVRVAEDLARRARQTTVTYLTGLIYDAAKAAGVETPPPPWEKPSVEK